MPRPLRLGNGNRPERGCLTAVISALSFTV